MSGRPARRTLVLAALAVTAFLVCSLPASLHGTGIVPVLALAALDVALVQATGGLAFARARSLDERQAALRDLAYRRSFRLLGLAMVLAIVAASVGTYAGMAATIRNHGDFTQVDSGIAGRLLAGVLELLLMMPTLVVAWMVPGRPAGDRVPGEGAGRSSPLLLVLAPAVPALAAAWLLAVAWAPAQAAGPSHSFGISADWLGSRCQHFATGRIVGAGFGATVGLRAHVCWNGRQAFVVGDPRIPPPVAGGIVPFRDSSLTACGADNVEDFAVVSGTTCTATTGADGTLHYTVRARVSPLPFAIGARDVAMDLVVTREGRLLEQP